MPKRPLLAFALALLAAPATAGALAPVADGGHAAITATPASEAFGVGVGGYYGYGHGYRYRYGHWGYPTWFYDPWPLGAYYGPARRWWGYPPPQPLWTGTGVVWLHPAPPGPVAVP